MARLIPHQVNILFLIVACALSFPATAQDDTGFKYISGDVVNFRKNPSKDAPILGKFRKGDLVYVSRNVGGWAEITASKAIDFILLRKPLAYVHSSLLASDNPKNREPSANADPQLEKELARIERIKVLRVKRMDDVAFRQTANVIPAIKSAETLRTANAGCTHPAWGTGLAAIQSLENLADETKQWSESDPEFASSYLQSMDTTSTFALEQIFSHADIAMEMNCLDRADKLFRHVVSRYVGLSYAAYRDRAKIGIDDIRSARSN